LIPSKATRYILVSVALILFYLAGVVARWKVGAMIVIRNQGGQTLRNVAVTVENVGNRYDVGDLAPGGRSRVFAKPHAESHINVEFRDTQDQRHVATVIGYVEEGEPYCASGDATILPSGEVKVHDHTTSGLCWKSWFDFID
jgi:hypothetical protein